MHIEGNLKNRSFNYVEVKFIGSQTNTTLERAILRRWNKLTTGFDRRPRVKRTPLYKTNHKEKYDKQANEVGKSLKNNRLMARNWIFILAPYYDEETTLNFKRNEKHINNELRWLKNEIGYEKMETLKRLKPDKIKPHTPKLKDFDTDLSNSIFNNISVEDAFYRGDTFFKAFENFHEKHNS